MSGDPAQLIGDWFDAHDGDDDFMRYPRADPYALIGPASEGARLIYATKTHAIVDALEKLGAADHYGVICRYGLPDDEDLSWIRSLAGGKPLLFLGDMDPVDLMIFAWLRAGLEASAVEHLGVSDVLIDAVGVPVPDSFIMPCDPTEKESLPVLAAAFPDLRETVGPRCADLLAQGRKIEIDAIVSAAGTTSALLRGLA